jgi:hypothetical protein
MSGYLSRIVQTAARSSQPLRPLAGSVFGTPAEQVQPSRLNDAPFIVETEVPASPPDTSNTQSRASGIPSSPAPSSILENYEPLQPRQQTYLQPLQDRRAPFETSHAQSQDHLPAADSNQAQSNPRSAEISPATTPRANSITPQAADKQAFAPRITHRSETFREQAASRPAQTNPTADGLNQHPEPTESKLSAQPTSGNQSHVVGSHALIPAQPAHMVRPQQPPIRDQRSAPAQEPSIEIHIGRIEVLAVHPPAASAPAPRRDRTTSLADYLAGQNGRRS